MMGLHNLEKNRELLFDGSESDFYRKKFKTLGAKGEIIEFMITEAVDFSELKKCISSQEYDKLLKEGEIQVARNSGGARYYGKFSKLEASYINKQNHIMLISLGEVSPAHFILYLEGVWSHE